MQDSRKGQIFVHQGIKLTFSKHFTQAHDIPVILLCDMVSGSPIIASMLQAQRLRVQASQQSGTPPCDAESETQNIPPESPTNITPSRSSLPQSGTTKRSAHNVLPIATRALIVNWMTQHVLENGETHIASKTVRHFPQYFRASENANLTRAKRLWTSRAEYTAHDGTCSTHGVNTSITRVTSIGPKRVRLKAKPGRGRKRAQWVSALYEDLRDEFDRLRKLGVKFNMVTLKHLALDLLQNSSNDAYNANILDPRSNQPLHLKIDQRWIQSFTEHYRIVCRAQTGKKILSPAKELEIEIAVASHLGTLCGLLESGKVDENDLGNADETHFIFDVDNGKTLGFSGCNDVKYADVVSGGEGFTMMVRISGGRDARIEPPFLVFTNKDRNYPIRGVPDNVEGVSYRTGPKGWMDTLIMPLWMNERRIIQPLPNNRQRVLFVDNCNGHKETEALTAASASIRTKIRFFPPNATHLVQPCDSFVIQKIKTAWRTHWETYKMDMIRSGKWKDSGRLVNPGKTFFLRLAARCIRAVNLQRDSEGVQYARKAMIITGMAKNTNGLWEKSQLTPQLQAIIQKHASVFSAARSEHVVNE